MNQLPEFLTRKYLGWQTEEGARKTIEEFAEYLGVNRSLLSFWMNGKRTPNEENVHKIAEKLGSEIYDILGIPRPNRYLQSVNKNWEFMSEEKQEQIFRMVAEEAAKYEAKKITDRVPKVPKRAKKGAG